MAPVFHVCNHLAIYKYPEDGLIRDTGQIDQLKSIFRFSFLSNAVQCALDHRGYDTVGERLMVEENGLRRYLTDSERNQVCDLLSDKASNARYVLHIRPDYGWHEKFPLCADNRKDAIREVRDGNFPHVYRIEEHDPESGDLSGECFLRQENLQDNLWVDIDGPPCTRYYMILFPETSKILRIQASDFGTTMERLKDFGENPESLDFSKGHDTLEGLFEAYNNRDSGFSGYCKFVARDRPEEELRWLDKKESGEFDRIIGGEYELTGIPSDTGYYAYILNESRYLLDQFGDKAIFHAVESSGVKVDTLDWLKEHGAGIDRISVGDRESIPMHHAALLNHVNSMKWLQQQGVDVDIRDKHGNTPMHRAALLHALEVLEWLHNQDADLEARNNLGNTPLHTAVHSNNVHVLDLLTSFGADMTVKNNNGETPVEFARALHAKGRSNDAMKWIDRMLKVNAGPDVKTDAKTDAGPDVKTNTEPDGMEMS